MTKPALLLFTLEQCYFSHLELYAYALGSVQTYLQPKQRFHLSAAHGPMSVQLIVNMSQHNADLQSQQQQQHYTSVAIQVPINVTLLLYCSNKGARPHGPLRPESRRALVPLQLSVE